MTGLILASHAITYPFSKYFQILYIFAQIFKYFALFNIFLPFLWKIARMPLLSIEYLLPKW